jgi:4-diphosphocytidyl-2-C-methyl-D-erythritol kinase
VTRVEHVFAPGKVNLCLYLGPTRPDGLHELVTVIQPVSLADELHFEWDAPGLEADEVVCPGVEGENLVARALRSYRERCGCDRPPLRVRIEKRIPVAAGLGGGSSDAAQTLMRIAPRWPDPCARAVAASLGSDVPAFLEQRATLVTRAGEEVRPLSRRTGWGFVIVPLPARLSAGDVYSEADRLGLPRAADDLAARRAEVEAALADGPLPLELLHNDLEHAARALCPAIERTLRAVAEVTEKAIVTGSGPTVIGICRDDADAHDAARALAPEFEDAVAVAPL